MYLHKQFARACKPVLTTLSTGGCRPAQSHLQTLKLSRPLTVSTTFAQRDKYSSQTRRPFSSTVPRSEDVSKRDTIDKQVPEPDTRSHERLREFHLDNRAYVVTGGAGGLGLVLAEAIVEAGGHVYCLDRMAEPGERFHGIRKSLSQTWTGSLHYRQADVANADNLDSVISEVAAKHQRMDGLVAAAGVQNVTPALEYPPEKIDEMLKINYTGVYLSAVACAKQMIKYRTPGSICLIGSMSGLIANKGFTASVYNSSKAAMLQLGRNLAMEWGVIREFEGIEDGAVSAFEPRAQIPKRGIRVNSLAPGNILTPMVRKNFADDPELQAVWEANNMMGRISEPEEFRGAVLFMLSDASSFMTGSTIIVDGGYTAW